MITKQEVDNYTIADTVEDWLKLTSKITNDIYKQLITIHLDCILNSVSLAANLLNPHYQGKSFKNISKYSKIVNEFLIEELDESGLESLYKYQDKLDFFSMLFNKNLQCIDIFWRSAEREHSSLSKFSRCLLRIPACTKKTKIHLIQNKNFNIEQKRKVSELHYSLKLNEKMLHKKE